MGLLKNLAIFTAITTSASIICSWLVSKRNGRLQRPPSPKGLPIVGHVRSLPSAEQWKVYHQWSRELNTDIIYLNFLGQDAIVLDAYEAATDLLERRSLIYSGRLHLPMLELVGWGFSAAFLDYGLRWRQQLRLVHNVFQPSMVHQFHPYILRSTHEFLYEILLDAEVDIVTSAGKMAGRTIMSTIYGIQSKSSAALYAAAAVQGVREASATMAQGTHLIDFLPFLKHVPAWVPGAGFQRIAARSRALIHKMVDEPFAEMKRALDDGVCPPCFCSVNLKERDQQGEIDDASIEGLVRDAAGALVGASSETTVSVISSCILGLLQNPSNIIRAHAELDKVIGPGQLPDFHHEPKLPFITAIVYETLRWRDIVPLGVPHKCSQDNVYKGYHISAGTMVFANMWAMLHNESVYPDPFDFNPSRFMKGDVLDDDVRSPLHACFGFGRRMCPGRHMAFNAIWMAVASILFCFDIQKACDKDGNTIEPLDEQLFGLTCIPKPYKSRLTPRSEVIAVLIQRAVEHDNSDCQE